MIRIGSTFRSNLPPRHIWIVVNDPTANEGTVLMVNMTTLRDSIADSSCVLEPSDYPLITHRTTIAYFGAHSGPVSALERLVSDGIFHPVAPVPLATLGKIIVGAHRSPQLAARHKRLLPKAW